MGQQWSLLWGRTWGSNRIYGAVVWLWGGSWGSYGAAVQFLRRSMGFLRSMGQQWGNGSRYGAGHNYGCSTSTMVGGAAALGRRKASAPIGGAAV